MNVATLVLGLVLPPDIALPSCHPVVVAAAPTAERQWVQIKNPCDEPLQLEDFVLRYTGQHYGFGAQDLAGELAPGACSIVQGFDPPLQPGIKCADAIAVFDFCADALTGSALDSVSYGGGTCAQPFTTSVDASTPGPTQHLQLGTAGWTVANGVTPSTCEHLPLAAAAEPAALDGSLLGPAVVGTPLASPKDCLRIEEVMYWGDAGEQWIDVRNICGTEVVLTDLSIQYTAPIYEWAWGVQFFRYNKVAPIPAHGCATFGKGSAVSFDPMIEPPQLGSAEGIGLFMYGANQPPFDAVIYGFNNERGIPNEDNEVAPPTAPDVPLGHSLRRTGGGWVDEPAPKPGKCG